MRTIKFLSTLAAITFVAVFFVRCSEDEPAAPVVNYGISGTVTYPDFNGTASPAGGAVVYLKVGDASGVSFDFSTIADASGNYTFAELVDGSYFVFANYDTQNTNNPGGRMAGVIFGAEGVVVAVEGAVTTQDLALVSMGQADAFAVNSFTGGDWNNDWSHSNIDFSFPYDGSNATYTGSFKLEETFVNFDPFNLGASSIEATIDVLTIHTDSPGGRDALYNSDGTLWQDATTMAYNLGCVHGYLGMANDDPTDANRYSTFKSTKIEAYGDGYLATGAFTVNGVTADVSMFFKFYPGFIAEVTERGTGVVLGDRQYSSFQGSFDFAAFQVFGIESGHIGEENDVTIDVSFQVTKNLY